VTVVIPLPVRPGVDQSDHQLLLQLMERVAELERRLPKPRFTIPPEYVTIQQASGICGYSPATLYGWLRRGRIKGAPLGGRRYVDAKSLPPRRA